MHYQDKYGFDPLLNEMRNALDVARILFPPNGLIKFEAGYLPLLHYFPLLFDSPFGDLGLNGCSLSTAPLLMTITLDQSRKDTELIQSQECHLALQSEQTNCSINSTWGAPFGRALYRDTPKGGPQDV